MPWGRLATVYRAGQAEGEQMSKHLFPSLHVPGHSAAAQGSQGSDKGSLACSDLWEPQGGQLGLKLRGEERSGLRTQL